MYAHIRLGNRESQTKQPSCKPLTDFTKFLPGGQRDGKRATFLQKKKRPWIVCVFFCGQGVRVRNDNCTSSQSIFNVRKMAFE